MTEESPQRLGWYESLVRIEAEIEGCEDHKFDVTKIRKFGILVQRMELDQKSDNKPRFFTPCSSLPLPGDEIVKDLQETLDDEDTCFDSPVDHARSIKRCLVDYADDYKYDNKECWSSKW